MTHDDERTPEDLRYRELFEQARAAEAELPEKWEREPPADEIIEELHAAEESE